MYKLINADCFSWMAEQPENSFEAVVTDPPYGVREYTDDELNKQRTGHGGIWRIPPSFDGHQRQAVPRFSVINDDTTERQNVYQFFLDWGKLAFKLLVPGGHIIIASTPLLSDILGKSMRDSGFERRGEIIRIVKTLRGGDRPKGAEEEFPMVSVIPRGLWEPWGIYRKPISERTVAENLRKWKTGGLRRLSSSTPFCDIIETDKTTKAEREIAPHPSIKPQKLMRQLVVAALPLGVGTILDPFAGSGSTIAAACAEGLNSVGVEKDSEFYSMAGKAIPELAKFTDALSIKKKENNPAQLTLL